MTIKTALETINTRGYTAEQVDDEYSRVARAGLAMTWTTDAMWAYFKMDRTGAGFALTRKQRAELFAVLTEVAQHIADNAAHKRVKEPAPGQDYEGAILSRQEAAGVE